jgi:ElaB/YqjD/DUF883 family membrane-anchored ribosome-binding protein
MNAISTENIEKTIRTKLESAVEKARDACERLEEKTIAAGRAADTTVRTHPYPALGIAFGLGLVVGVLAMSRRRD